MRTESCKPKVTSPVPRGVWESLIRSDSSAVVTQSLAWRDAVLDSGAYKDTSLLYEFPSGRAVVLPMVHPRWQPSWAPMSASWPGMWGVGGPISRRGRISPAEAAAVLEDVARRQWLTAELRLSYRADPAWLGGSGRFRITREGCYVLDLAGGFGEVWRHRFRGTARTAVRKAERSGLEVKVDRSGRLLGVFYDLYEKSIPRWASMQHEPLWLTRWRTTRTTPPSMLALVAKHFGESCTTWLARSQGEAVAAIIVIRSGAQTKYWRGAMDKAGATPVRANELLHRLAIEEACQDGCRSYEMGYAAPGSPLAAFKEKLGAALFYTHLLRAERLPVHTLGRSSKKLVKKMIGFQDV